MALGVVALIVSQRFEAWSLFAIISSGVSTALIGAGVKLRARGLRIQQPDGLQRMSMDGRPPIVILRPFAVDDGKIEPPRGVAKHFMFTPAWFRSEVGWTMEQVITEAFSNNGPVVAVGRPGEQVPPLGAGRVYVTTLDEWRVVVGELLDRAQLVLVIMGDGAGLKWELQRVLGSAELRMKTWLLAPESREARAACWRRFQAEYQPTTDIPTEAVALEVGLDGQVRIMAMLSRKQGWVECVQALAQQNGQRTIEAGPRARDARN